jgi:hypothetical protein
VRAGPVRPWQWTRTTGKHARCSASASELAALTSDDRLAELAAALVRVALDKQLADSCSD